MRYCKRRWLNNEENDGFRDQYARAREFQADALFDEILYFADNSTPESVQQACLQIDTLKWMAGKLRPKKYGDKIEHDHSHKVLQRVELVALEAPKIEHDERENLNPTGRKH